MFDKKIEYLKESQIPSADLSLGNDLIVETAGFVPLEVKFKRFEQNGMMMQFNENEFTSSDLRDIYLNPDFEISPEDDIEEVHEKLMMQQAFVEEMKKKKTSAFSKENTEVAQQGIDKKKADKKEETLEETQKETQKE